MITTALKEFACAVELLASIPFPAAPERSEAIGRL
jgi:hypothetical protein